MLAFGGNALLPHDDPGDQRRQVERAEKLSRFLVRMIRRGYDLVLVHGNGPQVGNLLIQVEEAVNKVPPATVDVCVAQTEGSIGYMLSRALRNALRRAGIEKDVVCLLSEVVVDAKDPANREPSKPIGPFYAHHRAGHLVRSKKWAMVEDAGRGFRRVVPSPRPLKVLGLPTIREALVQGHVVIACGGGGIPVVEEASGTLKGIEAVIDKDFTASLVASELLADVLVILTDVDAVRLNYGRRNESVIERMTIREASRWLRYGQFPAGSMGPKVEAAIEFTSATGNPVVITSVSEALRALEGKAGTWVTAPRLRRR
ncbi:MAG TPA: carbamate kinase [Candidatus Saccharimonadales bacterium]|nr:carbamate kinase [Candidatus Saccharimonadales bacterium]